MHLNSILLFKMHALPYFTPGLRVLEIGPDARPSTYYRLTGLHDGEWHTLDIGTKFIAGAEKSPAHIQSADPYNYPAGDGAYDIVLAGQVMEHIPKPWQWLKELKRVVKPGGHIILITPVSWPYHEAPVDCWRIYPEGMRALCEDAGMRTVGCTWESLEAAYTGSELTIPGTSSVPPHGKTGRTLRLQILLNRILRDIPLLRRFRNPVPVAYDMITILQK